MCLNIVTKSSLVLNIKESQPIISIKETKTSSSPLTDKERFQLCIFSIVPTNKTGKYIGLAQFLNFFSDGSR
jgi:hypothetical protein